jgi:hypothetical protein
MLLDKLLGRLAAAIKDRPAARINSVAVGQQSNSGPSRMVERHAAVEYEDNTPNLIVSARPLFTPKLAGYGNHSRRIFLRETVKDGNYGCHLFISKAQAQHHRNADFKLVRGHAHRRGTGPNVRHQRRRYCRSSCGRHVRFPRVA